MLKGICVYVRVLVLYSYVSYSVAVGGTERGNKALGKRSWRLRILAQQGQLSYRLRGNEWHHQQSTLLYY